MENVEGLLLGEAWSYVQKIYHQLNGAGYQVKHWLCKGENMGVPQRRHRVFFIALRNDISYDLSDLDMAFNYEPVTYGDIKDGKGRECAKGSKTYELLCDARPGETDLSAAHERLYGSVSFFQNKILYDDQVVSTIRAKSNDFWSTSDKKGMSTTEIISSQTFPQDYDFINHNLSNVTYICGMSVPPVMIKRIVQRLIESGVFSYKEVQGK